MSSHGGSTQTVYKMVHAIALTPNESKASEFPMAQKEPVGVPSSWDQFSPGCQYVHFMKWNSALDLFPVQRNSTYAFSPLSLARQFRLLRPVYSIESSVSTIPCRVRPQKCKS